MEVTLVRGTKFDGLNRPSANNIAVTLSSLLSSRICPITFCTGPFLVRYLRRMSSNSCRQRKHRRRGERRDRARIHSASTVSLGSLHNPPVRCCTNTKEKKKPITLFLKICRVLRNTAEGLRLTTGLADRVRRFNLLPLPVESPFKSDTFRRVCSVADDSNLSICAKTTLAATLHVAW